MNHATLPPDAALAARYAKCIEASRRVAWDIERDVVRGRRFDFGRKFLPDGLSRVDELPFLDADEARFLSQVQGRTYANMFALVEQFVAIETAELARARGPHGGDDDALAQEALSRVTAEELKHQALFRRLEAMAAAEMPPGYRFVPDADEVAGLVLAHGHWAVMALTLGIELFSLAHYRSSIGPETELCPLWTDVFLFHWKEESQHAIVDELEWRRLHAAADDAERDRGVDEWLALIDAVDATARAQARADAAYFVAATARAWTDAQAAAIHAGVLAAYRWQYIVSGAREPRFAAVLEELTTPAQRQRIAQTLAPWLAQAAP